MANAEAVGLAVLANGVGIGIGHHQSNARATNE
jgi:hypothetical protein